MTPALQLAGIVLIGVAATVLAYVIVELGARR